MRTRQKRQLGRSVAAPRGGQISVTLAQPVTVPPDFMGMCWIRWPVQGSNPTGVLNYGSVRLSQVRDTCWADIETSAGVYNWTLMDQIITFQRSSGKTVYWGLYATPRFYADNTTPNPTITDYNVIGPWGSRYGEGAMPTSLAAVQAFITAALTRYNLPGGVWFDQYGATLGKGVQYWETWNEPESWSRSGNGSGNGATAIGQQSTQFGWMSRAQLVDLHVTQHDTIKALDPSVLVTTPGFTGRVADFIGAALTLAGSVTSQTMGNTSDAVAWHPYLHTPMGWGIFGNRFSDAIDYGFAGVFAMREALQKTTYGSLPLWISEWGVDSATVSPEIIDWNNRPPAYRRQWIAGMYASCAALGVQRLDPWHWEINAPVTTAGAYRTDVTGAQAGYNLAAENLPGRTITGYTYRMRGEMTLTFSDNSTWTIDDNMPLPGAVPVYVPPTQQQVLLSSGAWSDANRWRDIAIFA
jgi:hypothetical protein